jgi:hypothetical protein
MHKEEDEVDIIFKSLIPHMKTMNKEAPLNGTSSLNLLFNNGKLVKINSVRNTDIGPLSE